MKKIICAIMTAVLMFVSVVIPSTSAYAANKDVIKKVKVNHYAAWEENEGGFACCYVKFSKVKGASYYQLKYRWNDESETQYVKLKKNRFHTDCQDVPEMIKVRSVKKLKSGKKKYGKWKSVKLSLNKKPKKTYTFRQHDKKLKKSKYQSVYFE